MRFYWGLTIVSALIAPLPLLADNWDPNSLVAPRNYPLRRPLSHLENLADSFSDSNPTIRINVARDLLLLCQRTPSSCERAREILTPGLKDPDPRIQTFIALNAAQFGLPNQPAREQVLLQALNDPNAAVRQKALNDLATDTLPIKAVPIIAKLLNDPAPAIQSLARSKLIQSGNESIVQQHDQVVNQSTQQLEIRKQQERQATEAAIRRAAELRAREQEAIRQRFAEQKRAFVGPSLIEKAESEGVAEQARITAEQEAAAKAEVERREKSVNAFRLSQQQRLETLMSGKIDDEEIRRYIKEYADEAEQEHFDEAIRRLDLIQQRQALLELLSE